MTIVYDQLAGLAHAAEPPMLRAWRRSVLARARDESSESSRRSALVVAPHPDDESLGCGATIARKVAAGTHVRVVIAADGRDAQSGSQRVSASELAQIRAREALEACAALGVGTDCVTQLGYADNHVHLRERELSDELHDILMDVRPDEVLVVSGLDHHPDHRSVNRAAHAALGRMTDPPPVREYPVWSWIDGPWLDQAERTAVGRAAHLVGQPIRSVMAGPITSVAIGSFGRAKRAAIAAHASQMSLYSDEPGWVVMDPAMVALFLGDVEIFLPTSHVDKGMSCSTIS